MPTLKMPVVIDPRPCLQCGDTMPTPWPSQKYCGQACYQVAFRTRKKAAEPPRACLVCAKDISDRERKTKYCSASCREKSWYRKRNGEKAIACAHCGGQLPPSEGPRRYCTLQCRYDAKSARRTREVRRRDEVWKTYRLRDGDYAAMVAVQGNRCAICLTSEPGTRTGQWHIDHDHQTDKVRALLCGTCNRGLGQFRDDPEIMRRAADYIEYHRKLGSEL